jgi:uncharacterized protein
MIHPSTELKFISKEIGYGVVAKEFIPKGTITWALDELDREFTPQQFQGMKDIYKNILETYSFRNNKGNLVLCWDNGRFVNHSFKSNCFTTAYDFEIAIRDIHPGEQLTDDYGYLNVSEPFEAENEGTERKIVYPDDILNFYPEWDKKVLENFKYIPNVNQPLRVLVDDEVWNKVLKISKGEMEMQSILTCHYYEK